MITGIIRLGSTSGVVSGSRSTVDSGLPAVHQNFATNPNGPRQLTFPLVLRMKCKVVLGAKL